MKAFRTLFRTEFRLSLRDMNLPLFALIMPVGFALVLGIIVKDKPAFDGAPYSFLALSFGAVSSISICATGFMGLPLVLSDYRDKKILRRYQVTPVSPALLLFVQFIINMVYCLVSLGLVYAVTALFFGYTMQGNALWFFCAFLLVLCAIFSIGLMAASLCPSVKTANLVCSLLYFPMLFLSGATVPYEIMPRLMQKIMDILPLTQGIKLLKAAALGLPMDSVLVPVLILAAFTVVCTAVSLWKFRWD